MNGEETKFMEINRIKSVQPCLIVLDYKFSKTTEFKFLGVIITSNNKQEDEIQNRLAVA